MYQSSDGESASPLDSLALYGVGNGIDSQPVKASDVVKAIDQFLTEPQHTLSQFNLVNFHVCGLLDLKKSLSSSDRLVALHFENCKFDSVLNLQGTTLHTLRIEKCQINGIRASMLLVQNDVTLRSITPFENSVADVDFYGSRVAGSLRILDKCKFLGNRRSDKGSVLDLASMRIDGDVVIEGPDPGLPRKFKFHCIGSITLQNSVIGGNLLVSCIYVASRGRGRFALDLTGTRIEHSCSVLTTRMRGTLKLSYSRIGTWVDLIDVRLKPRRKADTGELGEAIDASVLRVDGDFRIGSGCRFSGTVNLRSARIAAMLRLCDFDLRIPRPRKPEEGDMQVFALEASDIEVGGRLLIGSDLSHEEGKPAPFALGVQVLGGIRLDGARVTGDLQINLLRLGHLLGERSRPVMLSLRKTNITGSLDMRQIVCDQSLKLDLTTTSARVLGGNLKQGWGVCTPQRAWPLLDGFRYEALDVKKALSGEDSDKPVDDKAGKDWLKSQYGSDRWLKDVNLDPYQTLAKAFAQSGELTAARSVLVAGIASEWLCRPFGHRWWEYVSWPFEKVLGLLYWLTFGFGYSAKRALCSMSVCWAVGAIAVLLVNSDKADSVFVVDAMSISAEARLPAKLNDLLAQYSILPTHPQENATSAPVSKTLNARIGPANAAATATPSPDDEVPCGNQINPGVYALDVMVPLLDLRQESRCSVRSGNTLWTVLKALYAGVGAVVVSLGILTISGVLRRDLK